MGSKGRRALITGGCGFIGSRICKYLLVEGYDVISFDNLSAGAIENLEREIRNQVQVIVGDVRDVATLRRALFETSPDTVIHLAAIPFIPDCEANPAACIDVNVRGTQAVLDACGTTPSIRSVIMASSAAVYAPSMRAHVEGSPLGPTDIYGHTKLFLEQLAALFSARTGTPTQIARFFNVYGPKNTHLHLISTIFQQLSSGDKLLLGNLSTQREYIFVDDAASAIVKMADSTPLHGMRVFNIGSTCHVDGYRLVTQIGRVVGRTPEIVIDPARVRVSDAPSLLSDCTYAQQCLGWSATTDLYEGLRATQLQPLAPSVSRTL